ncbi:MAG: porphobilinogen synthase [Nitrospinota bacterium]
MKFPSYRARRGRRSAGIRRLLCESRLSVDNLIYPLFISYGQGVKDEISSMPNNYRISVDQIKNEVKELKSLNIPAVILFGIPDPAKKDSSGKEAYNKDGVVQQAIREFKSIAPELVVIADVCIDEYTDHGHCGLVKDGKILNDETLELLSKMALTFGEAGVDIVAPSDMMDGRIGAIRNSLDSQRFEEVGIISYSAKYASSFYGPFREACNSSPSFGDRRSYQMDPANKEEALREVALDIDENADIIMIKPALAYLDIISAVKERFSMPVAAYSVSGEFAMIEAAAAKGWIDKEQAMLETLVSIKRSGADMILTYHAKDAARLLNN